MMQWFVELNPITQAFLATCFTWLMTMAGAAVVLFFRNVSQRFLNTMLGFAAGVMIAASYWSLLAPAIEMASQTTTPAWIPAVVGFLLGGVFLKIIDRIMPHLHFGLPIEDAEGIKTRWKRTVLLVLAVTIHNIPEGLAVGVAFGAAGAGLPSATLAGAIALALGIGIQNFPEGTAVAVPLRREGLSVGKSFFFGQLSGIVEIIAGVIGAYLVLVVQSLLPYALRLRRVL
jgi:ZIP family zinc transporter